jgi:hypothetical protein
VAALLVGISDNPPGIILLYGAGLTAVLAVVHRWRSARRFGYLVLSAALGFLVLAAIHNFAEVGAEGLSHLPVVAYPLAAVSVVGFMLAVVVCPAAVLVGVVGWVCMVVGGMRRRG